MTQLNYRPLWSGTLRPQEINQIYIGAVAKMSQREQLMIENAAESLLGIRNLGDVGALEALAKLGLFLNGQTAEFTKFCLENTPMLKGAK